MEKVYKIGSNLNRKMLNEIITFLIDKMLITDLKIKIEYRHRKYFIEWETTPEMFYRFRSEFEIYIRSF